MTPITLRYLYRPRTMQDELDYMRGRSAFLVGAFLASLSLNAALAVRVVTLVHECRAAGLAP